MGEHKNQIKYHGHRYEWDLDRDDGELVRSWERTGSHARLLSDHKDRHLINRLNKLAGPIKDVRNPEDDETAGGFKRSEVDAASDSASESAAPKSIAYKKNAKGKGSRVDNLTETGKDSHGRNWYFDGKQKFYWILALERDRKKPGISNATIIHSGGRRTQVMGKKEMTLLLQQISKAYSRTYGGKEMLATVLPYSRVLPDSRVNE